MCPAAKVHLPGAASIALVLFGFWNGACGADREAVAGTALDASAEPPDVIVGADGADADMEPEVREDRRMDPPEAEPEAESAAKPDGTPQLDARPIEDGSVEADARAWHDAQSGDAQSGDAQSGDGATETRDGHGGFDALDSGALSDSAPRDIAWGGAMTVAPPTNEVFSRPDQDIAIDDTGNAVAVWVDSHGLRASRRPRGGRWGQPELVNAAGGGRPKVRFVDDVALTVWAGMEAVSGYDAVFASRATASGWGEPVSLLNGFDDDIYVDPFRFATNGSGRAVVVADTYDPQAELQRVYANVMTSGSWGGARALIASQAQSGFMPDVAMNELGQGIAVWAETDSKSSSLWLSTTVNETWTSPQKLAEASLVGGKMALTHPRIAMNEAGSAAVVWFDLSTQRLRMQLISAPLVLRQLSDVADLISFDERPSVAIDEEGNVIVVWVETPPSGRRYGRARRYSRTNAWERVEKLGDDTHVLAYEVRPTFALHRKGIAFVLWSTAGPVADLWAKQYTPGLGWGTAQILDVRDDEPATHPTIAVNASGEWCAVWCYGDNSIWSRNTVP